MSAIYIGVQPSVGDAMGVSVIIIVRAFVGPWLWQHPARLFVSLLAALSAMMGTGPLASSSGQSDLPRWPPGERKRCRHRGGGATALSPHFLSVYVFRSFHLLGQPACGIKICGFKANGARTAMLHPFWTLFWLWAAGSGLRPA